MEGINQNQSDPIRFVAFMGKMVLNMGDNTGSTWVLIVTRSVMCNESTASLTQGKLNPTLFNGVYPH